MLSTDTAFNFGSIWKELKALAVIYLVVDCEVHLDDRANTFLADVCHHMVSNFTIRDVPRNFWSDTLFVGSSSQLVSVETPGNCLTCVTQYKPPITPRASLQQL